MYRCCWGGPPGTGKTALAHHLAPAADAEEIVARLAAEAALKRAPATRIGF